MNWKHDSPSCVLKCQTHPHHHGNVCPKEKFFRIRWWKGDAWYHQSPVPCPCSRRRVMRWCWDDTCCYWRYFTFYCNIQHPSTSSHVPLIRAEGEVLQKSQTMPSRGGLQDPKALWGYDFSSLWKIVRYHCSPYKSYYCRNGYRHCFIGHYWKSFVTSLKGWLTWKN